MLKADTKYNGVVREGGYLKVSGTGTVGFVVPIECEDGNTEFTVWMTEKNKDRVKKTFTDALGIPEEKLQSESFFEHGLASAIAGREISFGTKEEEYKNKRSVKVAWIGKKSEAIDRGVAGAAAHFFGAAKPMPPITDDDIPF